jgi:thiol:disulfide interchange protein DsbD
MRRAAVALVGLAAVATVSAEEPRTGRSKVRLLSEATGAQSSGTFWLGLHVALQEGWHTYWVNPGDSGAPARIQWTLPPGAEAGDIMWPAPHRLLNPPYADYGYENEVLLLVPITTSGLPTGQSVTVAADVRVLVCKDICVPERSTVSLSIPVSRSPAPDADVAALFRAARQRAPGQTPASWRMQATARDRHVELTIEAADPPRTIEFFPVRPVEIQNAAAQAYARLSNGMSLVLQVDERRKDPPARLTGVLVADGTRAFTLDIPIDAQPPQ